jgi:hypothetical protein
LVFSGAKSHESSHKALEAAESSISKEIPTLAVVRIWGPKNLNQLGWHDVDGLLHARYGFWDEGGLILVRPDSYVSFAGNINSVKALLKQALH